MAPLLSWDIFMQGFNRRMALAGDLQALHKIAKDNKWHTPPVQADNVLIWQNKVIIITDGEGKIIFATENMVDMNGYTPSELVGTSLKMFRAGATKDETREIVHNSICDQKPFDTVITTHRKDGSTFQCHIEGHPMCNKQGQLVNFLAFETGKSSTA